MDNVTLIRMVAGALAVLVLFIIIWRRKRKSPKASHAPVVPYSLSRWLLTATSWLLADVFGDSAKGA